MNVQKNCVSVLEIYSKKDKTIQNRMFMMLMSGCLNNESISTRKFESINHFHYNLCRRLGGGMEIIMIENLQLCINNLIGAITLPIVISITQGFTSIPRGKS